MQKLVLLLAILLALAGVVSAIPNPSAVYCVEQGYEYEVRTHPDGGQYGVCVFPDGTECDAWQYYCKCEPNGIGCWSDDFDCHWPCEELPCKKAGEHALVSECCEGLEKIPPAYAYDDRCEIDMVGWTPICSDCGNGICETWESKCNCPQDCNCLDTDGDRICDWADNCPNDYNPDQEDSDKKEVCPVCRDGVCEGDENGCNCPEDCGPGNCWTYIPICGNGRCELYASPGESHESCPEDCPPVGCDIISDGYGHVCDNCPYVFNPDQVDSDGDGLGNVCDEDCPNLDGLNPVNLTDFSILTYNWQLAEPNLLGDLDMDGIVNFNDLCIFANYWLCDCW